MSGPTCYRKFSADSRFVFVVLCPWSIEQELREHPKREAEIREIRAKYSKSGMYRNDESREPVWTIEGYYPGVTIASDGVHAVLWSPAWNPDTPVLTFMADGRVLRQYRSDELIGPRGRWSGTDFSWGLLRSRTIHDNSLTFVAETEDRDLLTFNLRTGEMVSTFQYLLGPVVMLPAAGLVLVLAVWWVWRRKRRRAAAKAVSPTYSAKRR